MNKIRLIRTMVIDFEPSKECYPEGFTLEEMAKLDAENIDGWEDMFSQTLESDSVTYMAITDHEVIASGTVTCE